ncbi:MAG: leucyl aminopeptidase [Acidimicrobiia bacterium]
MQVRNVRSFPAAGAKAAIAGMYPGRQLAAGTLAVTRALGAWTKGTLEEADFDGEAGQVACLPNPTDRGPRLVVFVGLGTDLDLEGLRQAAGAGMRAIPRHMRSVATTLHKVDLDGAATAVLEGISLADYVFATYKSKSEPRGELEIEMIDGPDDLESAATGVRVITSAVAFARDLVNEPPGGKAPLDLAERVTTVASAAGISHEVWSGDTLGDEAMAGLLAVGGGSDRPPCMVRLEYTPRRPKAHLVLVGKGIVFDSGGLNIKSSEFMATMKSDMAGAAAVAAAVVGIARLGIKTKVTAYLPLAENLVGGGAQRPSDVITYRNGTTVEIANTDAEGRLVMADALCLASELDADLIVDVATLTGATKVALGPKIAGIYARDENLAHRVQHAADSAGERAWTMPLPTDYRKWNESPVADVKNAFGIKYGGGIGAALFLEEFMRESPWVHIDIAGPAFVDDSEHYVLKGGTGYGVRTLIELAASLAG